MPPFFTLQSGAEFLFQRAADAGKAVHVFDFDFRAEFLRADGAHGDVYVATDHAFFHVAIAHAAVNQNVLERVEVFVGHVRAGEVRLGNDFHERHPGTVEIHAAVALKMDVLADIFLQVRAGDADAREAAVEFKLDVAVRRGRFVVLCELVIFGHVRIEIALPVEFGEAGDFAFNK